MHLEHLRALLEIAEARRRGRRDSYHAAALACRSRPRDREASEWRGTASRHVATYSVSTASMSKAAAISARV